jgi:ABC-type polysaccharide/polyol phosphate transport system ATPase subunit
MEVENQLLKIMTSASSSRDKGGEIVIAGSFQRLALATGFDNELTARENIFLNGSLHGLSFKKFVLFSIPFTVCRIRKFVDTK